MEANLKKIIFLIFILIFAALCFSDTLPVAVDANSFFDASQNTILEINYQIYYRDLKFVKIAEGFEAVLEADFKIVKDEKVIYSDLLTNRIIVTDEVKTRSSMQFTDKISLTLSKSGFHFVVDFKDIVQDVVSTWKYDFDLLPPGSLVSDLELSSDVQADSSRYLEKFHRGDQLYLINASHIFSNYDHDNFFFYYELYNFERDTKGFSDLQEEIVLKKKTEIISEAVNHISSIDSIIYRTHLLPIAELSEGYYDLEVRITDLVNGRTELKKDFLSIKKPVLFNERMFVDLNDEFKLISYFLAGSQLKTWKTLSDDGKINYLNRFWTQNDPDPLSKKNDFFAEIKKRVDYSNKKFSHFVKGWSTDRGRIYLRNGKPDEVIEMDTGLYTKYSQKEFIIWKYRTRVNQTYIFIDLQMSGNFRLIYADGDLSENSTSNWQEYLGKDFEFDILE